MNVRVYLLLHNLGGKYFGLMKWTPLRILLKGRKTFKIEKVMVLSTLYISRGRSKV